MNSSYLLIRSPLAEAMARYSAWLDAPEIEPPREVADRDAVDLAVDGEEWKGLAVYVFGAGPWTVFEEISGGLAARPAEDWVRLASGGDLIYAGYNDAIGCADFVQVERGQLVRHFVQDMDDPSADVNVGKLPDEAGAPLVSWTDVARWVDEKEEDFTERARGWLWIHRALEP